MTLMNCGFVPPTAVVALRFNQRIASRKHQGLAHEFRIIEGERHAGMQLEAYTRGQRFAFAPLAPESGPATRP
jgi:hypothetical protein